MPSLDDTAESANCLDSTAVQTHVPQVVYCMIYVDANGNYTEVVYRSCVLRGSETWSVKKENELTLPPAEMRMIKWVYGIKVRDRFMCSELRESLRIDDIITVVQ